MLPDCNSFGLTGRLAPSFPSSPGRPTRQRINTTLSPFLNRELQASQWQGRGISLPMGTRPPIALFITFQLFRPWLMESRISQKDSREELVSEPETDTMSVNYFGFRKQVFSNIVSEDPSRPLTVRAHFWPRCLSSG